MIKEITLSLRSDSRRFLMRAVVRNGWAVHESYLSKKGLSGGIRQWAVTHEASGACLGQHFDLVTAHLVFFELSRALPFVPVRWCGGRRSIHPLWREWFDSILPPGRFGRAPHVPLYLPVGD